MPTLKNYDAALADYTRALELDPNLAQAYNNRGTTYAILKNYDAALADYTRALELDPNYAQAFNNRGTTYATLKNYDGGAGRLHPRARTRPELGPGLHQSRPHLRRL